jgi:ribose transport system substrate-binding protein
MGFVGLRALDEVHHYLPPAFRNDYSVNAYSPYPEFIDTGTSLIDKSNVEMFLQAAAEAQGK